MWEWLERREAKRVVVSIALAVAALITLAAVLTAGWHGLTWEWLETRDPNIVAAIAAAVASGISALTVVFNLRQMRQSEKERRAAICLEISRRYNELYNDLIELDGKWIEWKDFNRRFPERAQKLASDEWKRLRKAGGFFELVGAFVGEGLVDAELLFKFMNIRPRIWLHHKKVIEKMRETYFPELWHEWECIVNKYYESNKGRQSQRATDEKEVSEQHRRERLVFRRFGRERALASPSAARHSAGRVMERVLNGVRYRASVASEGGLFELHRFCTGVVPEGFAGLERWRERHGKNPNIFHEVTARDKGRNAGDGKLVGSFAVTPLNEGARALLEQERLKGMTFKVEHITAPDETPAALYISGIVAEGFRARGATVGFLSDMLARETGRGARVLYARPMSDAGMRMMEAYGFKPVDPEARGQFDRIYRKELS